MLLLCAASGPAAAQSAIVVGDVVIDPPTVGTLGFSVPIISGDTDYDAAAARPTTRSSFAVRPLPPKR